MRVAKFQTSTLLGVRKKECAKEDVLAVMCNGSPNVGYHKQYKVDEGCLRHDQDQHL